MKVILNFFLHCELVPLEDLGFWELKMSEVSETLLASSLQFLDVKRCFRNEWCQLKKKEEEAFLISLEQMLQSTNTLELALILWKCMVDEHVS